MRVVAIIQARLGSQRLPSKVLMPISGEPMIAHVLRRAKQIPGVDEVWLATDRDSDSVLSGIAHEQDCSTYYGDPEPLARYVGLVNDALDLADDDYIVRITGDCPGLDPEVSGEVIKIALKDNLPYACNLAEWPDGLDTQVFTVDLLRLCADPKRTRQTDERREHITPALETWMNAWTYEEDWQLRGGPGRGWKWSVDTEEDLEYVRELYAACGKDFTWQQAVNVLPGALCPLCADGVPHTQRSLTSIGGARDYIVYDLHDCEVSGGVAPAECIAWQIAKRRAQVVSPTS